MTQCNDNFLSPTGFILDIPGFSSIGFHCVSANIPGISMGGPQQATPFNDFQLSADKLSYDNLTVRFLVDEYCANYALIHNWMVGITYPQKSTQWRDFVNEMIDKKFADVWNIDQVDITLTVLTSNYNPGFKIQYVDAFPVALTPVQFTTEDNDINYLKATATFQYMYYKITDTFDKQLTL